ncbi:19708_t:CDS:1, partial [Racocetra fulgida]
NRTWISDQFWTNINWQTSIRKQVLNGNFLDHDSICVDHGGSQSSGTTAATYKITIGYAMNSLYHGIKDTYHYISIPNF